MGRRSHWPRPLVVVIREFVRPVPEAVRGGIGCTPVPFTYTVSTFHEAGRSLGFNPSVFPASNLDWPQFALLVITFVKALVEEGAGRRKPSYSLPLSSKPTLRHSSVSGAAARPW